MPGGHVPGDVRHQRQLGRSPWPVSGEPLTWNLPSFHSRSASLASSRWAASFLAFSFTLRAAIFTAEPQTAVVRLP